MPQKQAKANLASTKIWRVAVRYLLVVAIALMLGSTVLRASKTVGHNARAVGFWHGVFHGALMPCAMPALLIGRDVAIYAPNNNGHAYKLGYTIGVNGCGLLFFGILFVRLNRLRKRINVTKQSSPPPAGGSL